MRKINKTLQENKDIVVPEYIQQIKLKKIFLKMMSCYEVMLSNNIKLFKSLENSENFLRGTTRKIISQVEGLLNFLEPLMKLAYHY